MVRSKLQEVTAIPKPRERDPNDKIKGKRGGRPQRDLRRQMTAKFRKELVERKRAGQETPADAQAVDQVEQTGAAALEEAGQEIEHLIDRAARPGSRPKEQTETSKGKGRHPQAHQEGEKINRTGRKETAAGPSGTQTGAAEAAPTSLSHSDTPPAPGERMKRKAARSLEQAKRAGNSSQGRTASPGSLRYGNYPTGRGASKDALSLKNQSTNPSLNQPVIKERLRRSTGPSEKPLGGAFVPKTRQRMKQAAGKKAVKAAGKPAGKRAIDQAGKRARAAAQKRLAQRASQAAKVAANLSRKAAVVAAKAVAAIVSALASLVGGTALVLILVVVLIIGALLASPFGLLFSNEPTRDAVPLSAAVAQVNIELTDRLADLQNGDGYDRVEILGHPPDWREVAAVFAVKTAGAENGADVAALTPEKVELLRGVFWDMCTVSSEIKTVEHPASGSTAAWSEEVLFISISAKTAEEMRTTYALTEFQSQSLNELLAEMDTLGSLLGDLTISQADALELLQDLPADLAPERRAVVETACKLVGKVNYFWGGKSLVIGWDSRWGTLREVTAAGNSTSGTYRPYGLDCSGFVDWVFYNITGGEYIIGHGGGAHAQHTYCTAISWEEAQPGDLVFYPEDSHVGIVGGRDENGNLQIVHCVSGANNVVITGLEGFTSIGRPLYYEA